MANANSEHSPAMQKAIGLLRNGKTVEAEELMVKAAHEAEQRFGAQHAEAASAWNELGMILLNVDNFKGSVQAFRQACAGPLPVDAAARKDRLSYLLNLGTALQYTNELDEAEDVLRDGCEARKAHYGVEHAGYAFGLEPLAELLLRRGKVPEAIEVLQATVENFWRNGHARVATALALRAEALKLAGRKEAAFSDVHQLPEEILQQIVSAVAGRTQEADPGVLSSVLQDFAAEIKPRLGADHHLVTETLIHVGNLEFTRGEQADFDAWLQAIHDVLGTYDRQQKPRDSIQALQGLARALSAAGRNEEAIDAYRQAADRSQPLGDACLRSQVQRNFGLLLSDLKRDTEAEAELRGAVQGAQGCKDSEMLSRAQIALGIFYQHRRRLDEARPLLQAALKHINPAHSDAVMGRGHLEALESGQSCGCGNQQALAAAFREFVIGRLPQDLVQKFEVRLENNDFKIQVQLKRKPEQEELEHLNRVINHAQAEFRKKLREQR